MIETAPKEARGGNSAFTGRRIPLHLFQRRRPAAACARHRRPRSREHRLRQLHRRPVFRRHGPADRVPLRPRSHGGADRQQLRRGALAAQAGRPVPAGARPAGVQGGRQSSSSGADLRATSWAAASIWSRRCTNGWSRSASRCCTTPRPPRCCAATRTSRACACGTASGSTICAPAPWCWPAAGSNRMPRCARAISARTGTSRRCAAPDTTPASAIAWRSTSAPPSPATGRARMPCSGT